MSSSPGRDAEEPIGSFMNPNEQQDCPTCGARRKMKFLFPAPKEDECEEKHAWRFQRCPFCGWTGDVVTGKFLHISHAGRFLIVNGDLFSNGLREYLEERELCQ
jgi:hypothetical protein